MFGQQTGDDWKTGDGMNADELWERSTAYVALAGEHFSPKSLMNAAPACEHDRDEWLRLSFLFPTLPEKGKADLLVVRRFFMIAREQQERERHDPDDSAEYSEAMADEVAQGLKESLRTFSVAQREILRNHYLIIHGRQE